MSDEELAEKLRDITFDGDAEAASTLRNEAQRTIDAQMSSLGDIDSKAIKILRINLVLTGIILTLLSFVAQVGDPEISVQAFVNPFVGAALVSLLLSSAMAALTYTASDLDVGVDPEDLARLLELDVTVQESDVVLTKGYARWIDFNDETNVRNTPLITGTILLVVFAIAFLSLGVYDALLGPVPGPLTATTIVALVIVTLLTGFVGQVRRAFETL